MTLKQTSGETPDRCPKCGEPMIDDLCRNCDSRRRKGAAQDASAVDRCNALFPRIDSEEVCSVSDLADVRSLLVSVGLITREEWDRAVERTKDLRSFLTHLTTLKSAAPAAPEDHMTVLTLYQAKMLLTGCGQRLWLEHYFVRDSLTGGDCLGDDGEVLLALNLNLVRLEVIRWMRLWDSPSDERLEWFKRKVDALASLDHPTSPKSGTSRFGGKAPICRRSISAESIWER